MATANTIDRKIKPVSVKSGVLMGVILLAFNIVFFYFIINVTTSAVLFLMSQIVFRFIVPIGVLVSFCFFVRKKIGGYWTFREAVTGLFIMFLLAYSVQTIGIDLIFAKFIEPDMTRKTETAALAETTLVMKQQKIEKKLIDKKTAELKNEINSQKPITVAGVIQNLIFSILFIFIFALVFAALFKRELPDYVPATQES
jgi:hypothetical protein